jgi:molybdenum cofactor cytidylyltransferase
VKFGAIPLTDAEGAILAHGVPAGGDRFPKGTILDVAMITALQNAGVLSVIAAQLEAGDIEENAAAEAIGKAVLTPGLVARGASTGRVNIYAEMAGVIRIAERQVHALNRISAAVTLATVPDFSAVTAGAMIATVKIIPFAAPKTAVQRAEVLAGGALRIVPFQPLRAAILQTQLPMTKTSVLAKTEAVTRKRIDTMGGSLVALPHVGHDAQGLATAIKAAIIGTHPPDVIVVFGASAVADADDVIPAAIRFAGGKVIHVGMPVDPGNLLVLGRIAKIHVLGAPGCARSPKENGFDWVLARLFAGIKVTARDIQRMGVGGLLTEIPTRPRPREMAHQKDISDDE